MAYYYGYQGSVKFNSTGGTAATLVQITDWSMSVEKQVYETTQINDTYSKKCGGLISGSGTVNLIYTGDNNTFIGYQSGLGSATQGTNKTCLGYQCYVDASNTVVLGDENIVDVKMGSAAQATASLKTITFTATTYGNLGTPANGTLAYYSDCLVQASCAGSGTGALAKRLNGAWVCN